MKRRAQIANVKQQPVKKKRKMHNTAQRVKKKRKKTKANPMATSEEELKWLKEEIEREEEECNKWEKKVQTVNKRHLEKKDDEIEEQEEDEPDPVLLEKERLESIKSRTEKMLKRMENQIKNIMKGTSAEEILTENRDSNLAKQAALDWIEKGGSDVEIEEEDEDAFHEVKVKVEDDVFAKPKPKLKLKPKPKRTKRTKPSKPKKKKRRVSFGSGPNPVVKTYTYEAVVYEESEHEQDSDDHEDEYTPDDDDDEDDEMDELSPEEIVEVDSVEMEDVGPVEVPEAVPEKVEEVVPKKVEEAGPEKSKIHCIVTIPKVQKTGPEKVQEARPENVQEADPEPMEEEVDHEEVKEVGSEIAEEAADVPVVKKVTRVETSEKTEKEATNVESPVKTSTAEPMEMEEDDEKQAEEEPMKEVTQETPVKEVIQETPVQKATQEAPVKEVTQEAPVKQVTQDAPVKLVTHEVPVKQVTQEVPVKEDTKMVTEEAPVKEATEEAPVKEITEEAPVREVTQETPVKEVIQEATVKKIIQEAPVKEVQEGVSEKLLEVETPEEPKAPEVVPLKIFLSDDEIVDDETPSESRAPEVKPPETSGNEPIIDTMDEDDSESNSFMSSTSDTARESDSDTLMEQVVKETDTFLPSDATTEAERGDGEIDLGFGMDEEQDIFPIQPTTSSPKPDAMEEDSEEDDDLEPITVDLSPLMEPMEEEAGMQIEAITLEPIEFDFDDEYGNFENEALSPIIASLDVPDTAMPEPPKLDIGETALEYASMIDNRSKQLILSKTLFQSLPIKLLSIEEDQIEEYFHKPAMYLLQYRKFNPYQWYAIYTKTLQFVDEFTFLQARTFISALSVVSDTIAECVKELKTRDDRNLPNHIYKKSLLFNLHHIISLSLSTGYIMKPTIDGELLDFMKGDKLEKKHKINFTRFLCAWIQVMAKYDEFEELLRIILTRFNIDTRVMLLTEIKDCLPQMTNEVGFFEHHAELLGTILGYWEHLQQEDAMKIRKLKSDLCCDLGHNKIIDRAYLLGTVENQLIQINNSASQLNDLNWMESDALLRSLNQLTYDVEMICLSCNGYVTHHTFQLIWRHLKGVQRPKPQFFFLRLIAFLYRGILDRQHFAELQNITDQMGTCPHTSTVEINFYKEYTNLFLRVGKATPNNELASCLYCCLFVMREQNLAYELKEFKDLDDRKIMKFIRFFPSHEGKIRGSLGFGKLDHQSIHA